MKNTQLLLLPECSMFIETFKILWNSREKKWQAQVLPVIYFSRGTWIQWNPVITNPRTNLASPQWLRGSTARVYWGIKGHSKLLKCKPSSNNLSRSSRVTSRRNWLHCKLLKKEKDTQTVYANTIFFGNVKPVYIRLLLEKYGWMQNAGQQGRVGEGFFFFKFCLFTLCKPLKVKILK